MKTIKIECSRCNGTGLYIGMAEHNGAAVVCNSCKGLGETTFSYNEFTGRKKRENVKRVYKGAYGYGISAEDVTTNEGKFLPYSQYGCTYEEWLNGAEPKHIEFLYCPYMADNKGIGNEPLERCRYEGRSICGLISDCKFYDDKATCWKLLKLEVNDDNPELLGGNE